MKRFSAAVLSCLCLVSSLISAFPANASAAPTKIAQARPAQPRPGQPAPAAPAPTNNSGQALEIAPPVLNLTANPGQVIKSQISLRDIAPAKVLVKNQVNDFMAAGEDGTPKIITDENSDYPYSIKKWLSPIPDIALDPRQIKNVPITISVPANAAPGGYYGVVRFTATAPELKNTGVSLSASLGSLILIRVSGQAKEKLEIAEFTTKKDGSTGSKFYDSAPITFIERIKNAGNVFEQPRGKVTVTDMFGKTIAGMNVNLPPRNILPDSIRRFEQPLDKTVIGNKRLFGKYTAKVDITYGDPQQTVSDELTFWIIPYKLIGFILIVLIVLGIIIRLMLKSYANRVLRGSRGRRRR